MLGRVIKKIMTISIMISVGALLRLLNILNKKISQDKPIRMEDYLYKIARVTGVSEYDIFCKSAENWSITPEKIKQDFSAYLLDQRIPYYVTDFVRENKKHLDELKIPLF